MPNPVEWSKILEIRGFGTILGLIAPAGSEYERRRPLQEAACQDRRGRARPRRYAPNTHQQGGYQGHLSSRESEGSVARRAAYGREFQYVREFAPQLQRHSHVAVRGDFASPRARN